MTERIIIKPGNNPSHHAPLKKNLLPSLISIPQSGVSGGMPRPKKDNEASIIIASAMLSVATTRIDGRTLGKINLKTISFLLLL
jgi:hypothetical protein